MALAFLMTLQAAAAAPSAPATSPPFDLAKFQPPPDGEGRCRRSDGEILVCGRPAPDYPIDAWEKVFATRPIVAEKPILGGSATVRSYVEQVDVGGFPSKRLMVGVKLPF